MILASTFTGDAASDLARQLVYQIRSRNNLPAYAFNFTNPELLKENKELEAQHRRIRVEEAWGVLVGGYKTVDAAHDALTAFKKLPAPELKPPPGVLPFPAAVYGEDAGNGQGKVKAVMINPFAVAHVVHNPMIRQTAKTDTVLNDKFLLTLNADEEFSLLKNPHAYTLAVKEYASASFVQQSQQGSNSFLKSLGMGGGKEGESLNDAASNAHDLADRLRKYHPPAPASPFEVYVLHTRTSSVVAVGGFDRDDDPNIEVLRQALKEYQQVLASLPQKVPLPDPQNPLGLIPGFPLVRVPHP
jgi:hypothetical protein